MRSLARAGSQQACVWHARVRVPAVLRARAMQRPATGAVACRQLAEGARGNDGLACKAADLCLMHGGMQHRERRRAEGARQAGMHAAHAALSTQHAQRRTWATSVSAGGYSGDFSTSAVIRSGWLQFLRSCISRLWNLAVLTPARSAARR